MKQVTAWQTGDGALFTKESDAQKWEAEKKLRRFLDHYYESNKDNPGFIGTIIGLGPAGRQLVRDYLETFEGPRADDPCMGG